MDPGKKWSIAGFLEPGQRVVDDLAARALRRIEASGHLVVRQVEVVEITIESLTNAPPVIEHIGADKAAGPVSGRAHDLRERRDLVADIETAVVAHTMKRGKRAC